MSATLAIVPDTGVLRKARGAFFTPDAIAEFIVNWAVRDAGDRVLEPSCGEAAFLVPAARLLQQMTVAAGGDPTAVTVAGVDIHPASAESARELISAAGAIPEVLTRDFFQVDPEPVYTAVIGNPPFVRYQDFTGEARAHSRAAALRAGVPLSGLASSWAAFTIHSALFLQKGGRLGLVLPAELLSVNYAAEVRKFLMARFTKVSLVMFTERVFPEVQEDVVLLLAEGYDQGHTDHANIYQAQNAAGLETVAAATTWKPMDPRDKWTPSLLSADALGAYSDLLTAGSYVPLETWGDTTLGMVTGNNKFFGMSPARVIELELQKSDLIRISPPGSAHLRGLAFTESARAELGKNGSATYLFRPSGEPSEAGLKYIAAGEVAAVDTAYKCRVRKPWWRVPLVKPADLLLTYMNADTPRITTNSAAVHHLNSVHGIYLRPEFKELGRQLLPLASLTSMTLVGAETVGRAYGGGMLKIEPREADRLPVPSAALVEAGSHKLTILRPQMATFLRYGRLVEAAKLVDEVLLVGELGMKRSDVKHLRDAHAELASRRAARGKRGTN